MGEAEVDPEFEPDERPPFGSWPKTYALALGFSALCIALLYWLTAAFNLGSGGN